MFWIVSVVVPETPVTVTARFTWFALPSVAAEIVQVTALPAVPTDLSVTTRHAAGPVLLMVAVAARVPVAAVTRRTRGSGQPFWLIASGPARFRFIPGG